MHRKPSIRFLPFLVLPIATACSDGPRAQEHAHEHTAELEPVGVTVFGQRTLLYLEHPRLVRGEPARFLAHLTVLATGEPVRAGTVTLHVGGASFRVDAPKREGLFVPEGSLAAEGSFPARLVVAGAEVEETLELGAMVVHANRHDAEHAAGAEAAEEAEAHEGAVPFLLEQQWKVKLLLAEAGPRALARRLVVPARIAAPEGAAAIVSAPLGGRLLAPPSGTFARTGASVEAGQVLALVEPPLAAPELAQLRALELEFDLKALDVLRAVGEADAKLRFAEQELERLKRLRPEGLSTQHQVDLAEQNLAVAKNEGTAAAAMKTTLDEIVAGRERRSGGEPLRFPLSAPIGGTLVEARRVPGESVAAGEAIFRILDAKRLRVEGRVLESDLAHVLSSSEAIATLEALPGRRFDLTDFPPYVGHEVDEASRTLLVRYELDSADPAVRVGMLARLEIATGRVQAAVSIPFDAVVMDQGFPTAYVMLEGELFQERDLELGVRDGEWVEVRRGLEPGQRVATRGAYLVRLAALSPASFGHGHAH